MYYKNTEPVRQGVGDIIAALSTHLYKISRIYSI